MHTSEASALWDCIDHLLSIGGTVGVLGTCSTRSAVIIAEGKARNFNMIAWDSDQADCNHQPDRDYYAVEVLIVADALSRNYEIPVHVTIVDTSCQPYEQFAAYHKQDYRHWNAVQQQLVSLNHLHNWPQINVYPDLTSPITVANDFFEVYPELWSARDLCGFIYYGPTAHQGDPTCVPFETQVRNIKHLLDNGAEHIMLCNSDEALQIGPTGCATRIARYFVTRELANSDAFWLITGCLTGEQEYAIMCDTMGQTPPLSICTWHRFEQCVRIEATGESKIPLFRSENREWWQFADMEYSVDDDSQHILDSQYRNEPKDKNFVSFARVPRHQRIQLVAWLQHNGLLDTGYVSFDLYQGNRPGYGHENREAVAELVEEIEHHFSIDPLTLETDRAEALRLYKSNTAHYTTKSIQDIQHTLPLTLNRTVDRDNPVQICADDVHYHETSRFSIVNETVFYAGQTRPGNGGFYSTNLETLPGVFISEKMYKPLAYLHPFVVFSRPGTLQALRDRGFHTFDIGLIDETYDTIQDDSERFNAVCEQIQRLCDMSDEEFSQRMAQFEHSVIHNRNLLYDFTEGNSGLRYTDMRSLVSK